MLRDSADLGTPSAPPIFEIARDEKGFEVESQGQEACQGLTESNGAENWTCPSRGSMGFDGSVDALADLDTSSFKASELGDRYCKKTCLLLVLVFFVNCDFHLISFVSLLCF